MFSVTLPSFVPGRIGLDGDNVGNGRVIPSGSNWFRLIARFKCVPFDPKYPIIIPRLGVNECCRLRFQDWTYPFLKWVSIAVGLKPAAAESVSSVLKVVNGLRVVLANCAGVASGGFPLSTVGPGRNWST